jgi:hypothetical protein
MKKKKSQQGRIMGKYRVSVFKTLLSSDGHLFKCLQFMVDIGRARTAQRAVEVARCRYQRRVRIPDWKSIADIVEVKELETLPFRTPAYNTQISSPPPSCFSSPNIH